MQFEKKKTVAHQPLTNQGKCIVGYHNLISLAKLALV